ncbi:hypothetical protein G6F61_015163 [Rhizopus arrhizus]|nr:hypothetical protein G6F61_015163 [Rhizopus arrhizus]KAG1486965.1 hypothetical protein G6F53_013854 [Rhizopus delemar]
MPRCCRRSRPRWESPPAAPSPRPTRPSAPPTGTGASRRTRHRPGSDRSCGRAAAGRSRAGCGPRTC